MQSTKVFYHFVEYKGLICLWKSARVFSHFAEYGGLLSLWRSRVSSYIEREGE
jgi:hypothetical protein